MASSGNGTSQHLSGELFKMMTGVSLVHVPYRGAQQALTDLIGGQVQISFDPLPPAIELIRSGKVRALAVTTAVRSDVLPDVPTIGEFVPGYEASGWNGIVAPRNTPIEIIQKLNTEINAGLADPGIRAKLTDLGGIVLGTDLCKPIGRKGAGHSPMANEGRGQESAMVSMASSCWRKRQRGGVHRQAGPAAVVDAADGGAGDPQAHFIDVPLALPVRAASITSAR
jgi:Tripartite tricarboxylate transporter family receptor